MDKGIMMLHEIMEIILNSCNICEAPCAEDNCPLWLIKEKVVMMLGDYNNT